MMLQFCNDIDDGGGSEYLMGTRNVWPTPLDNFVGGGCCADDTYEVLDEMHLYGRHVEYQSIVRDLNQQLLQLKSYHLSILQAQEHEQEHEQAQEQAQEQQQQESNDRISSNTIEEPGAFSWTLGSAKGLVYPPPQQSSNDIHENADNGQSEITLSLQCDSDLDDDDSSPPQLEIGSSSISPNRRTSDATQRQRQRRRQRQQHNVAGRPNAEKQQHRLPLPSAWQIKKMQAYYMSEFGVRRLNHIELLETSVKVSRWLHLPIRTVHSWFRHAPDRVWFRRAAILKNNGGVHCRK